MFEPGGGIPRVQWQCPQCGDPIPFPCGTACAGCTAAFHRLDDLPDFIGEQGRGQAADQVTGFYDRTPFPGYARGDNAESLIDRCRRSPFLDALDRSLAIDATVLDCGCGTGQLASFLALTAHGREVWAVDAGRSSLRALEAFRLKVGIANLHPLRADLFQLPFAAQSFDLVVSRGVVHHTPDPGKAIDVVARLVAPGGYLVLGWYEPFGRAFHHLRQGLAKMLGRPVDLLDPILRQQHLDEEKRRAWIEDQYLHPLEVDLPLPWVVDRVGADGLQWLRTVPPASHPHGLFQPGPRPAAAALWLRRLQWAWRGIHEPDAGLVSLVARRPG